MIHMIQSAGLFGYLLVGLGILTLPLSLATVVMVFLRKEAPTSRGLAIASLAAGGLALVIGALGYKLGLVQVDRALELASPEFLEEMRAVGRAEALNCLKLGFAAAAAPLMARAVSLIQASGLTKP